MKDGLIYRAHNVIDYNGPLFQVGTTGLGEA